MAGWSALTNGSLYDKDCLGNIRACQGNGICTMLDHAVAVQADLDDFNNCKVKLKGLFNQIISIYIKEISSGGLLRPFPVMLCDGQPLDLFELFWLVKGRGGYPVVSKERLWPRVLEELELGIEFMASVKLVFCKYLNGFEGWFRKRCAGDHHVFKSLPLELRRTFRELLSVGPSGKWERCKLSRFESTQHEDYIDVGRQKNQPNLADTKKEYLVFEDVVQKINGVTDNDDKSCRNNVNDLVMTLNSLVAIKQLDSRKRKREGLSGMLNWLRFIAMSPRDPSIGPMPEPSKSKDRTGKEFWVQALRAREARLLKRHVESNYEALNLESQRQRQKAHPDMYEDKIMIYQTTMKLRCSERLPAVAKSRKCSCCNLCSATHRKSTGSIKNEAEHVPKEQSLITAELLDKEAEAEPSEDDPSHKQVSIGALFQAEVPEWTGVLDESDSKWLGARVWPLKCEKQKTLIETSPIGKGMDETCNCPLQGSVECIRFHISEQRMRLKLEVGLAFFHWGLNHMGEEVSLQWTPEEEKRFKVILRSDNISHHKHLWNNSSRYFPKKSRRDLVSYYFNVYLIRRRTYQNRVTPYVVDSDDDESDFGSICDGFGEEAVQIESNSFIDCPLNKQWTASC